MDRSTSRVVAAAAALDLAVVIAFVVLGRSTHQEGNAVADAARTAAPFLGGLAAGWVATRAWRAPLAPATGAGILAMTVAGGMVLRRLVFGDGTAASFVIVAAAVLTIGLVGWRAGAATLRRRRDAGPATARSDAAGSEGLR